MRLLTDQQKQERRRVSVAIIDTIKAQTGDSEIAGLALVHCFAHWMATRVPARERPVRIEWFMTRFLMYVEAYVQGELPDEGFKN